MLSAIAEAAAFVLPADLAAAIAGVIATDATTAAALWALGPVLAPGKAPASRAASVTLAGAGAALALVPLVAAMTVLPVGDLAKFAFAAAFVSAAAHAVALTLPSHAAAAAVADRRDLEHCWSKETIRCVLEVVARVALGRVAVNLLSGEPAVAGVVTGAAGVAACVAFQSFLSSFDGEARPDHPVNTDATKVFREERGVTVLVPAAFHRERVVAKARKGVTMEEVSRHCTRDDAWICVEGRAYDVTKYVEHHPGGWLPISNLAGKDVTDAFANYHPSSVYEHKLPNFFVGDIVDYVVPPFVAEHRAMRQELLRRNRFETRPSFYLVLVAWCALLLGGAIYLTAMRPTVAEHMAGAVLLAAFWQQVAFVGHDIGHNAVTHDRSKDLWWGVALGNLTGGVSLAWWKRSHNVHHVVCNSIENDPDIQHMPIFAVDKGIFGRFFSSYHQRWVVTDDAARALVQWQHLLYLPIMAVARFNLYVQGYILLLSGEHVDHKALELGSLAGFFALFGSVLYASMSGWQECLAYLLVSHCLAGLLHVQITLSHFAEDTYHGMAYNDESDEWFRMQVKTSLNVDCPEHMDWFHGGLQFQVEHHLYPRLPRHNLRECRTMVRALCAKHGIEHKELPFLLGVKRVLDKLHETAAQARTLTKGDGGFYESAIYHGLNALG